MKVMLVEGTPQEMNEIKRLGFFDFVQPVTVPVNGTSSVRADSDELTEETVVNALSRSGGLTQMQKDVIRTIYRGNPKGVSSSELARITGLQPNEVKSAMRTIGKRVTHTPGWPEGKAAFDKTWTGMQNIYRLHPVMRAVLDNGIVKL